MKQTFTSNECAPNVVVHSIEDFELSHSENHPSTSQPTARLPMTEIKQSAQLKYDSVPFFPVWVLLAFSLGCTVVWLMQDGNCSLSRKPAQHPIEKRRLDIPSDPEGMLGSLRLYLNPESIRTTKLWRNLEDLKLQLEFGIAESYQQENLTYRLLDGSVLNIGENTAELLDSNGDFLGNIVMGHENTAGGRALGGKKSQVVVPPPVSPVGMPAPTGVYNSYPSEMYCRYGCGNIMGVTFPYYYRPFFGYGFPLLGTEANFPSGYGGNPVTALGASGALSGGPGPIIG